MSKKYNVASIITDSLNLKFDFMEGGVENYELILADIVTSSDYRDIFEDVYFASLKDDTVLFLEDCLDFGFNTIDEMAKKANVSANDLRQEWHILSQTLDQMKLCENPDEFATLFGKCSIVVDKYIKADQKSKFLNGLNGKQGYKGTILNITLGAAVDTMSEIITYYSSYDAYCAASDTFKDILSLICCYTDGILLPESDEILIEVTLDEVYYSQSLSLAIKNFLGNAGDEATSAKKNAEKFVKEGIDNLESSFVIAGVDFLFDQVPIVGGINKARKAMGLTAAGAMFIVDCSTKIDDRAYTASMIYHLYFLANYATMVADDCGQFMVSEDDSEKAFMWAGHFDEAIRIWRCCTMMLCEFGIDFESYCLQSAQKHISSLNSTGMEKASWYSTAISIAALEKNLTSNIHCHDRNLSHYPSLDVINWSQNLKIVTIACPVSVCVTDEDGKQIAFLSDDYQTIEKGYEPYFHILEAERGSNDYMKICCIPNNWKITFSGTGYGAMHVLMSDIIEGKIHNSIKSPEITITEGMEGDIVYDGENIVVINSFKAYTITFNANGGNLIGDSTMLTGSNGRLSSLPVAPDHDANFIFKGWYTKAAGGTLITTNYVFKADTTLYAQWNNTVFSKEEDNSFGDSSNSIGNNTSSSVSNTVENNKDSSLVVSDSEDNLIITHDKSVDTGDTDNISLWMILAFTALVGILAVIVLKKKKKL